MKNIKEIFELCKTCRNTMSGKPDPCSDWCDACLSDIEDEYGYETIEEQNFEFKVPSSQKYEEISNIDFLNYRV